MHWIYISVLALMTLVFASYGVVMAAHGYFMVHNRVPYVRLPKGALREAVAELGVRDKDVVYDLGCGDGRVLMALRAVNKSAKYIGVENDWTVWLLGRLRTRGVTLVRGEISQAKLSEATRVFAYLGPKMMAELEPRFERELQTGARVVSVQFPLPNRPADKVVDLEHSLSHAAKLYVYNY